MKWIGLTGGMGCGKSTALKVFKELGLGTASADKIVHSLYQQEEVVAEVCKILSIEVQDFTLSKIANLVFSDKKLLLALEDVLHPKVRAEVLKIKKEFSEGGFFAGIYEIPLLFEKNLEESFDFTICIGASEELQYKRIKERNTWSDKEIDERLSSQMDLSEKKQRADFYIDNSGTRGDLKKVCLGLVSKLKN